MNHNNNKTVITTKINFYFRLAIVTRCPGYLEGGVPALANPCLYICENSSQIALQYACRQLGLPVNCIRMVPASTSFGTFHLSFLDTTFLLSISN